MKLDDSSVYDGVRRLSNTNSKIKNPHFASQSKIYWWNISWQEYNTVIFFTSFFLVSLLLSAIFNTSKASTSFVIF